MYQYNNSNHSFKVEIIVSIKNWKQSNFASAPRRNRESVRAMAAASREYDFETILLWAPARRQGHFGPSGRLIQGSMDGCGARMLNGS